MPYLYAFWFFPCLMITNWQRVAAQVNGEFPFVTVPEANLTGTNIVKIFSTQVVILLENSTESLLREEIFLEAAREYYSERTRLGGFIDVGNIRNVDIGNGAIEVSFEVTYNYTILRGSIDDDDVITTVIGTVGPVQRGFEENPDFNLMYRISQNETTFRFSGNSVCEQANCPQGRFMICNENIIGVRATCRSSCLSLNRFCLNDGWCMQSDGNIPPLCSCKSSFSEWYLGTFCELYIALWVVALFLVLVLVIIIGTLLIGCCLPVRIRKGRKNEPQTLAAKPILLPNPLPEYQRKVTKPANSEAAQPLPRADQSILPADAENSTFTAVSSITTDYESGYDQIRVNRNTVEDENNVESENDRSGIEQESIFASFHEGYAEISNERESLSSEVNERSYSSSGFTSSTIQADQDDIPQNHFQWKVVLV